jgi:5-formyltetrahydrofolate cyclo-ligase
LEKDKSNYLNKETMTKKEIRSKYKALRDLLSPTELERRSEQICEMLFANFQLSEKTVSVFLPIERLKEINTYMILEKGISIGSRMALPKINEKNLSMKHILYESQAQLEVNSLGIPEPRYGKNVNIKDVEIVLVPLLANDEKGNRVGYGKGYYDRFLKKCSATTFFIGLNLFDEFETISDLEDFDIQLHFCVTPNKVHRFV